MSVISAWSPTVLLYHGFSRGCRLDDPYHLHLSDEAFRAQLQHLSARGWQPLDLDGYLGALKSGRLARRQYLLTIDDALQSVHDIAIPLLAQAAVPAVLFAPAGLLGSTTTWLAEQPDEPIMTADELRAADEAGVEIGVHGWGHASMLSASDCELQRSTRDARAAIADVLGHPPRAFAYPYGDYDARAIAAVASAGFEVGFSLYRDAGRFAISRADVKPADSVTALRVKLAFGPHYRRAWAVAGTVPPIRGLLRNVTQRV